jgi:hypothetical protein
LSKLAELQDFNFKAILVVAPARLKQESEESVQQRTSLKGRTKGRTGSWYESLLSFCTICGQVLTGLGALRIVSRPTRLDTIPSNGNRFYLPGRKILAVKSLTSVVSHKQGNVMLPTGSAEFQHFILRFNKQAKFCPAPELS